MQPLKFTKEEISSYINKVGVRYEHMGTPDEGDRYFVEGLGQLNPESITDEMLEFAHRQTNDLNAPIILDVTLEAAASFIVEQAYLNQGKPENFDGNNSCIALNV